MSGRGRPAGRGRGRGKPAPLAVLSPSPSPSHSDEDKDPSSDGPVTLPPGRGAVDHEGSGESRSEGSVYAEDKDGLEPRLRHSGPRKHRRSEEEEESGSGGDEERPLLFGRRPAYDQHAVDTVSEATDEINDMELVEETIRNRDRRAQAKVQRRKARERARTERMRQRRMLEKVSEGMGVQLDAEGNPIALGHDGQGASGTWHPSLDEQLLAAQRAVAKEQERLERIRQRKERELQALEEQRQALLQAQLLIHPFAHLELKRPPAPRHELEEIPPRRRSTDVKERQATCHVCRQPKGRKGGRPAPSPTLYACATCTNHVCAACAEEEEEEEGAGEPGWTCAVCRGTCCCSSGTCSRPAPHVHCAPYRRSHPRTSAALVRRKRARSDDEEEEDDEEELLSLLPHAPEAPPPLGGATPQVPIAAAGAPRKGEPDDENQLITFLLELGSEQVGL